MAKKRGRTPEESSIDPAAIEMLSFADETGVSTAFSRADDMKPCPIGAESKCCKNCSMGPCRLVKAGQTGVCGATIETVVARNFARAVAAGAAAHSDHGRDLAHTLMAVAEGQRPTIRSATQKSSWRWPATWTFPWTASPSCSRRESPKRPWPSLASRGRGQAAQARAGQAPGDLARAQDSRRATSTARSSRCCTAPTWATTRTPSTSWTRPCALRWPTAGAARCSAPTSRTCSLARPARCWARSTWAS